ncbi:hypothetical protein ACERII_05145 [Evansella sp. AB-rgal1]|uniref:hypothetical protein n=1 Tax=Evansella sp. AB-rgal1 TaxID=3242696 RepID=UPI00359D5C4F
MKSLLTIVACIFLLGACSNLPKKMPEDFNFVLKYGYEARDIVNTYENTYTKNMIEDEDITIELVLTDNEKEAIYKEMRKADILASAEKSSESTCSDPHQENELTLTLDGETYEREWITSYCGKRADRKLKKFTEFIHTEIISKKNEYNRLPEASGGYD